MAKKEEMIKTDEDLGLGAKVIQENRSRFINPDGSFNVHRKGMFERGAFSPYHALLNKSWVRFYLYILSAYLFANIIFTGLYLLAGPGAFSYALPAGFGARFGEVFFFSIQVVTTLGSSALQPATVLAKTIFALEAMTGILGFSVGAGLIFARLSNPATKIIFSRQAVIAPFDDGTAFMFRIVNGRSNELVEMSATLTLAITGADGKRSFHQLPLERSTVLVFPLNWTLVHPITKDSPLYGMTADDLARAHAEFLVGITGNDQDLSKKIYARHSYLFNEVAVGSKFTNIIERTGDGTVVVDPARIHEIEKGFTLIELLVVIGIIAILSVVVILTLNPAELLRQSRDSSRVSDMATIVSAMGVYAEDVGGSPGTANTVYVSVPDPSATSTAGDQCQGLGLATLPANYSYHCASTAAKKNVDSTGWMPVNLKGISSGAPVGALPVDPANVTSTRLYYTYTTNASQYETTASMESQKYKVGGSNDVISNDGGSLASVYEKGTKLGLEPLDLGDSSLIGYWTFEEGSGTVAYDYSGSNTTGTWYGTQSGLNGTYYATGEVGNFAGNFNGIDDAVGVGDPPIVQATTITLTAWIKENAIASGYYAIAGRQYGFLMFLDSSGGSNVFGIYDWGGGGWRPSSVSATDGKWHFVACSFESGVANGTLCYFDGALVLTTTATEEDQSYAFGIGDMFNNSGGALAGYNFSGAIDDVRMYNRVLSVTEIKDMFSGGK